jgi:sporulation protein YlmC with PRC-barrel domain
MELIRDLLDKQVVDRQQTKIGKVDGIVMEIRAGKPPRITSIEIGATTLARRLGPRIGHVISRLAERLGGEGARMPCRISWDKVRDVGVDIEFDVDVRDTTIFDWQNWLRDKIICHMPGA